MYVGEQPTPKAINNQSCEMKPSYLFKQVLEYNTHVVISTCLVAETLAQEVKCTVYKDCRYINIKTFCIIRGDISIREYLCVAMLYSYTDHTIT